jgi:hypothetical protein
MLRYYWQYRREVKNEKPILPTRVTRMCTNHLKIKCQDRWMRTQGFMTYDAFLGIRYDEPRRWSKLGAAQARERYEINYPLVTAKVNKNEVLNFWRSQPFDLALDAQAEEGNCRYCFLKKTDRLTRIMRKHIERNHGKITPEIQRWVDRERLAGMSFRDDRPNFETLVQIALSTADIPDTPDEEVIDCFCGSPAV